MRPITLIILLLFFSSFVWAEQDGTGRPEKPNVIFILTDDLGWQDVKCYDIDEKSPMETPNIDKLASQGVQFWQGYSPAPTCAPTRCAILSGMHPARTQKTHVVGGAPPQPYANGWAMMPPWYSGQMPVSTYTISEALQEAGYTTGHCGKWHVAINHAADPQPPVHGFDWTESNLGTTRKMMPDRMSAFSTEKEDDEYKLDENGYSTHQNSLDALHFVGENKDKPFFLYYATWLVHTPIHTRNERLLKKYMDKLGVEVDPDNVEDWKGEGQTNPYYCAMVEELDYYMGQLFNYLHETEDPRWPGHTLFENTYIIFTSDNGGMEKVPGQIITDNYPLDRGKISLMEGGTRVPLVVTGPGIKAGGHSDVMINGLDFYPTILSWTGATGDEKQIQDGLDLTELLSNDVADGNLVKHKDGKVRDTMMWHFPNSAALQSTIRVGDYKLVKNYNHYGVKHTDEYELYRLYNSESGKQERVDIEEAKSLAEEMPEKVAKMSALLDAQLTEMDASYPYYNPNCKQKLPGKENVPTVAETSLEGRKLTIKFQENGAKVKRVDVIYTLNAGHKYEEWFRLKGGSLDGDSTSFELPEGTTHYFVNLVDENQFLVSHPFIDTHKDLGDKKPSSYALAVDRE